MDFRVTDSVGDWQWSYNSDLERPVADMWRQFEGVNGWSGNGDGRGGAPTDEG